MMNRASCRRREFEGREGLGPTFGVRFQDDCLLTELQRSQAAAPYLGVERVTTDAIAHAELADGD